MDPKDPKSSMQLNSPGQPNPTDQNASKKIQGFDSIKDFKLFSNQPSSQQRPPSIFDNGNDIDLFGLSERTEEEEREFLIKTFGKGADHFPFTTKYKGKNCPKNMNVVFLALIFFLFIFPLRLTLKVGRKGEHSSSYSKSTQEQCTFRKRSL
jgi:hypothetical protein